MNILLTVSCTKSAMETLIQIVKFAQSQQQKHQNDIFGITLFLIFKPLQKGCKETNVPALTKCTRHYIF